MQFIQTKHQPPVNMYPVTTFSPSELSEGVPGRMNNQHMISFKTANGAISPFIYWKFNNLKERDQVVEIIRKRVCQRLPGDIGDPTT